MGYCTIHTQSPHCSGKVGKMAKKTGKRQEIWNSSQNRESTGNSVCASCKFPDSKGKGYCAICTKIS